MSQTATSNLHRLNEIAAIVLLATAVFYVLGLVSFDPDDPVWYWTGGQAADSVANYGGKVGATLARTTYELIGICAFAVPILILMVAWNRFWIQDPWRLASHLSGAAMILAGVAVLAALLQGRIWINGHDFDFHAGGAFGRILADFLITNLARPGALLFGWTFLGIGVLVATRLSVREAAAIVTGAVVTLYRRVRTAFHHWRETRRKEKMRREVVRKYAQQAAESESARTETEPATPPDPAATPKKKPPRRKKAVTAAATGAAEAAPAQLRLPRGDYTPPPLELLHPGGDQEPVDDRELVERSRQISSKCQEFGVGGQVVAIQPGPVVTTYEFKPDAGVKYSRIVGMADDLCLALEAECVRIDRISGKSTVGMEVPNRNRQMIRLRELLTTDEFRSSKSLLTMGLGKRVDGRVCFADLAKMPHLLVAGATGAGKSVGLNCMITSILYRASPEEVKFIFIDPKMIELGIYEGLPHLMTPVVTDPRKAAHALRWAVGEMERRYKLLATCGVRGIEPFNGLIRQQGGEAVAARSAGEGQEPGEPMKPLPYIVIVIDELADLMMVASNDVEDAIMRLAQMARAVGIHLILATQRPSVDVITGVIKANFPSRIAYRVSSKVDSRTILDTNGAEQLLGRGDMLFLPPGSARLVRVHGAMLEEEEVHKLLEYLKSQAEPEYSEALERVPEEGAVAEEETDELYPEAVRQVLTTGQASISHLQRRMRVGYARAARLVDRMEIEGIVGPAEGSKPREILVDRGYLEERFPDLAVTD